jgi:hypothetical protein
MIVNSKDNLEFLLKDLPRDIIIQDNIDEMWSNIRNYINYNIDNANDLNNKYLTLLDTTASNSQSILTRLKSLSNLLADIYSIGGESNTSHSVFDEGVLLQSNGVSANPDILNIALDKTLLNNYIPKSIKVFTKNGQLGNSKEYDRLRYSDIENIVGNHSRLEIESFDSDLSATIRIDLGQVYPINNISFNITNFGVRLPIVESISTSTDGATFKQRSIIASNDLSIDLEEFTFHDGNIILDTEEFSARYIDINITQRASYPLDGFNTNRYAIGISSLSLSFNSATENGNLIVGPITSSSEILKVSLLANVYKENFDDENVLFDISHDLETWYPLENSNVFNPASDKPKVLNFNNISDNSIDTDDPISKIYLRVSLKAIDASYLNSTAIDVRRSRANVSTSNKRIPIENVSGKELVFKSNIFKYGDRISYPGGTTINNAPSLVDARINGITIPKSVGIADATLDITSGALNSNSNDGISTFHKFDKCHVYVEDNTICLPTDDFDPYSIKIWRFSKPISSPMNIETDRLNTVSIGNGLPILPIDQPAGMFYLEIGTESLRIDLSEGFAYSNSQLVYQVDDSITQALLFNEVGERLAVIDTQTINDIKYIDIGPTLGITYPTVAGLSYNTLHPIIKNSDSQFTVEYGRVLFGKYYKGQATIHRVLMDKTDAFPIQGLTQQRLSIETNKQIKARYQLLGNDLKTTVKLNHTNIVNGTVGFDISQASINAFFREVPFEDGTTEFKLPSNVTTVAPKGVNEVLLNEDYVEDGEISFLGAVSTFSNRVYSEEELIEEGDWMIHISDDPIPQYTIKLPIGILTNEIIDVEITYNIQSDKTSTSGLYSIDYKRGILHTSGPIDHRTYINYNYSYIFAEYESLEYIPSDRYSVLSSHVVINDEIETSSQYLVVIKLETTPSIQYLVSPTICNLKINTITAEDFV